MKAKLGLAIPCFNESQRIDFAYFDILSRISEIQLFFIDDGSIDSTGDLLKKLSFQNSDKMFVLTNNTNMGKTKSIIKCWRQIIDRDLTHIGFLDADGATSLDDVIRIVSLIETKNSFDAIWGSRVKLSGRKIDRKLVRHILGRLIHLSTKQLYKQEIYDTQAGIKVFKITEDLKKVVLSGVFKSKWFLELELLCLLEKNKVVLKIWEEPLNNWNDVPGSKIKLRNFFEIVWNITRLYNKLKFYR